MIEQSAPVGIGAYVVGRRLTGTATMDGLWNFWSGGKDNNLQEQSIGLDALKMCPGIEMVAHYRMLVRAQMVRAMVGEYGLDQVLVAGTGLPLRNEVHQIAQRITPSTRVVYADADPNVMTHARALLTASATNRSSCGYVDAGLDDPAGLLEAAAATLDLRRPVGVLLITSLDALDDVQAAEVMCVLNATLAAGSCIGICHLTGEGEPSGLGELIAEYDGQVTDWPTLRRHEDMQRLFSGTFVMPPGIVMAPLWKPPPLKLPPMGLWCGVGGVWGPEAAS